MLAEFLKDIKISHTLFSMPYVVISYLSSSSHAVNGRFFLLVFAALLCARTFAMGFNRLVDQKIDAKNERTQARALPAGRYSKRQGWIYVSVAGAAFIWASFLLHPYAALCSPGVLIILGAYSFLKRFTWVTHFYLGVCLGLSTLAVPVAMGAWPEAKHYALFCAVSFWTAGFDIIYSLQDLQFDRREKLFSFPARFGAQASYLASACLFILMVGGLLKFAELDQAPKLFTYGIGVVAALLTFEIALIRDVWRSGTSRWINVAFFQVNASVGVFLAMLYSTGKI